MHRNYITPKVLLLFLLTAPLFCFAQSRNKNKTKYTGEYMRLKFGDKGDTVIATGFFTIDSFAFIYMIKHDSDYALPLYRGTWQVTDTSSDVILHYDNGEQQKSNFEEYGKQYRLCIGSAVFYLQYQD